MTCASFIASSRADCVRGVVRLISSASTMLAKIGPGLKSNSRCLLVVDGHAQDVAGQQVGRELDAAERAVDAAGQGRARTVLPTPGTSSISTWPPASRQTISWSTADWLPATRCARW